LKSSNNFILLLFFQAKKIGGSELNLKKVALKSSNNFILLLFFQAKKKVTKKVALKSSNNFLVSLKNGYLLTSVYRSFFYGVTKKFSLL